jgi:hypothetical protein
MRDRRLWQPSRRFLPVEECFLMKLDERNVITMEVPAHLDPLLEAF